MYKSTSSTWWVIPRFLSHPFPKDTVQLMVIMDLTEVMGYTKGQTKQGKSDRPDLSYRIHTRGKHNKEILIDLT